MKKILLAGATGHLGQHLLQELKQKGYYVKVLCRDRQKAAAFSPAPDEVVVADATIRESIKGACKGMDMVISALGKSISLKDKSKDSFQDIDFRGNLRLLREAKAAGVQQFMYVSAFMADQHPELAYFKAHADFAATLRKSGMPYIILEPTALFSAFTEVVEMAANGRIAGIGKGDKRTNPVFEGDVARIAVDALGKPDQTIAIGGKRSYSRMELLQLACKKAGYAGRIPIVPAALADKVLPLVKLFSRNLYDKLAFFVTVTRTDCLAPETGELTLEEYFELVSRKV